MRCGCSVVIYARATIERPNWSLARRPTQRQSTSGRRAAYWYRNKVFICPSSWFFFLLLLSCVLIFITYLFCIDVVIPYSNNETRPPKGRVNARRADVSRRVWNGSARRNHQSTRHTDKGAGHFIVLFVVLCCVVLCCVVFVCLFVCWIVLSNLFNFMQK